MTAKILNRQDTLIKISNSFQKISKIIKQTFGPSGNYVIINDDNSIHVTKDGYNIIKSLSEMDFESQEDKIAALIARDIATKTVESVGDGTTSSIVLSEAILSKAVEYTSSQNTNMKKFTEGMELAESLIVKYIKEISKPVGETKESIKNIATISANNDKEVGEMISGALDQIGIKGTISIESGDQIQTKCRIVKGLSYDKGYISPFFAKDSEKGLCELDTPYILIYDGNISSISSIINILEAVNKEGKSLLIIADKVENDVLKTIIINSMRGMLKICCVNAPSVGDLRKDIMMDIAILTGGKYISEDFGLKLNDSTLEDLGRAKKVKVTKDTTIILDGQGSQDEIKKRCSILEKKEMTESSSYSKEKIKERISKMSGGIALIEVGSSTETEAKSLKDRLEDALHATKAAIEGGVVSGGGLSFIKAKTFLEKYLTDNKIENKDTLNGFTAIKDSLTSILEQMSNNAGLNGSVITNKVESGLAGNNEQNMGFNVLTGKYEDLMNSGVIDPAKVIIKVLQASVSAIKVIACNGGCVYNVKEEKHDEKNKVNQYF